MEGMTFLMFFSENKNLNVSLFKSAISTVKFVKHTMAVNSALVLQ